MPSQAHPPHARRVFVSSFSTGPPEDRGALHCQWNAIATQPIGLVSFQARGIVPVDEEQSLTVAAAKAAALRINLNVEGCDGQTSPHRPLLVVSRSTCPPLSPSPHANIFIIGTAVIRERGLFIEGTTPQAPTKPNTRKPARLAIL